jgi:insulysin
LDSFGIIPNKDLKRQNFELRDINGSVLSPYGQTLDEVIVFDSVRDQNALSFVFHFESSEQRLWSKSTFLVGDLLQHEGDGSLYQLLKKQGLIEKIYTDDMLSFRTVIHQFYIEFRLTDLGVQRWTQVAATLFQYLDHCL